MLTVPAHRNKITKQKIKKQICVCGEIDDIIQQPQKLETTNLKKHGKLDFTARKFFKVTFFLINNDSFVKVKDASACQMSPILIQKY